MWLWQIILFLVVVGTKSYPLHGYAPSHDHHKSSDYSFSYGVKDLHTGDVKHQWEKKDGDVVKGHYSVLEPDGSVRTVDYTADGKNGFNAVVKHDSPGHHPIQKPKAATSHSQVQLKSPEHYDYTTLKETYKTEYNYKEDEEDEEENASNHYVYVPQDEVDEENQESIEANVKIPYKGYREDNNAKLPLDLSLLTKGTSEKLIPVDVSLLNPVEIDLTKTTHNVDQFSIKNQVIQPSHQLSQEEINKYLKDYYQAGFNDPLIETGFKPIIKGSKNAITQPNIPQTFKSNKKPITTPGLRNFSSKTKLGRVRTTHNLYKRENSRRYRTIPYYKKSVTVE